MKLLVLAGANVEAANPDRWTPLLWAVSGNKVAVVEYLLEAGAKVNIGGLSEDYTPLHLASIHNYVEIAKILIFYGAKLEYTARNRQTPLLAAVSNNSLKVAQLLIHSGANTNAVGLHDTSTALHWAIRSRNSLITRKAPPAALEDNLKLIKTLVKVGVDVNLADGFGEAPIHKAAWSGALEVVDFLINAGAHVNIANVVDETPIAMAAHANNPGVVRRLVSAGAHVNPTVVNGAAPSHTTPYMHDAGLVDIASVCDALKSVKIRPTLFNLDESVNHLNPLAVATSLGHVDIVKYLISVGASLEAAGGAHALLVRAVEVGSLAAIKALGLDVNLKDDEGDTLLSVLVKNNRKKAVETIVRAGADWSIPNKMVYYLLM